MNVRRLAEAVLRRLASERLRQIVIERVVRVVSVAHPTNKSGNNMSQR